MVNFGQLGFSNVNILAKAQPTFSFNQREKQHNASQL